ncbi:MAG: MFS transporter [Chloroflexi bacterium]|nr:MAG: MFS transporter [Chloroflexota bacterium]
MPQTELTTRVKVFATIGVMLALLLAALDQTIVGTALPRIVSELNGLDRYSWLITGYLVASTVVVPIAGKMGDLFGRKPFLIAGMAGFVAASALCGISQDMNQLIVFRIIQGLMGGMLFASAFTVLADIFPPAQRAKMQGLFGGVFGLSSIVGPVLGGYITDNLGWRWVFYVNLPVGLLGVIIVAGFLPFIRTKASWRDIDVWGSAALAAGLIPILVALSVAKDQGWTSFEVLGLLALGAAMLIAFFVIEQRVKEPIVPFRLFKNRTFAVSMIVGFFSALGMFGMIIFIPLETQGVLGVSVTNSGLLLTPMMLGLIAVHVAGHAHGGHHHRGRRFRDHVPALHQCGAERITGALSRCRHEPDSVLAQHRRHGQLGGPGIAPGAAAARGHSGPGSQPASARGFQLALDGVTQQSQCAVRPRRDRRGEGDAPAAGDPDLRSGHACDSRGAGPDAPRPVHPGGGARGARADRLAVHARCPTSGPSPAGATGFWRSAGARRCRA